ncbi:adenine deaminase [Paenibacillus crassostreae]|uniref:Adenine deaminase n=1 Tax=Paenibacillus crassostreae TaxID=1763538 RepID=A0A167FSM1_9BACL|nr:adenine deaminase C-terminal domain-containing protein [Paenibacillus crassostreae]AOZ94103.1 adenosine deaminase [Paenibacillus crassostreae]OAB76861.1 adenosine deaminase [Paenibacillus crassostreae]
MTQSNQWYRSTLADCMPELVATARGDLKATLAVINVKLVNVISGEILPGMSIAIRDARIAYVGKDISHTIDENTIVVDAQGKYAAPGLLDGHCHIESTQLTVTEFAKAVLPLGTTGGFFDAHEISNVMGLRGLRFMLEEARSTPLAAYMQVASCVPSTHPGLETTGAFIGPEEVAEALRWGPDMIGLGEVMNFPGVVYGDDRMIREIQETLRAGKYADGHFTWNSDDWRLPVYAASGISGDHECVTKEDVIERIRLGMYAKMRQGSAWHDVAETIKAHTEDGIDTRRMMLVTDDRSSESLLREGHINFVVRHAIAQGVKPVTAFQMATINTAERFGVSRDIGSITPGSCADIILLDGNLSDVDVVMTIAAGQVVAKNGQMTATWTGYQIPEEAFKTVHIGRQLVEDDFKIVAPIADGVIGAKAIEVVENHVDTREQNTIVKVENHHVNLNDSDNLCKMAVFERHGINGGHALGILMGVGLKIPAAIAMTVAHDSHNLTVIGNNDVLMAKAGNMAVDMQGGVVMVTEEETTVFPLPVGGLMSPEPFEKVALQSEAISQALLKAGCTLNNVFMTLSLLCLVVIPEIRLSDKGLVRISADGIEIIPLFNEVVENQ